jgi:hypothetical protein
MQDSASEFFETRNDRALFLRMIAGEPEMSRSEYSWQKPHRDALLEFDLPEIERKVHAAEGAIFLRIQQLGDSPEDDAERRAIHEALSALRGVLTEKLSYPKFQTEISGNSQQS